MKITLIAPRQFENIHNSLSFNFELPPKHSQIVIGRGEQLEQYCTRKKKSHPLDLSNLDNSISRIHARMIFSPVWLKDDCFYMQKKQFKNRWQQLPEELWELVHSYLKPKKNIVLQDMKSKLGLYEKISETDLYPQLIVTCGENKQISFVQQLKINKDKIRAQLELLRANNWNIKGVLLPDLDWSVWKLEVDKVKYALVGCTNCKYVIGRASNADVVINHSSVSRKQALIKYQNKKWKLIDGNGTNASINGLWRKIKKGNINPQGKYTAKIGLTMMQITFEKKPESDNSIVDQ